MEKKCRGTQLPAAILADCSDALVVDVENVEEAISLAARVPAAGLGGAVEVRPAEAYWGR